MKLNKISPLIFALFFYFLAITINLFFDIISINYSTSSTASIGYIFAPIDALISSLPWLLFGFCIGYGIKASTTKKFKDILISLFCGIISFSFIGDLSIDFIDKQQLKAIVLAIEKMDAAQLENFVIKSEYKDNKFALGAVSLNPKTSSQTLAKIAANSNPQLHIKMWHAPAIMGENRKGLAVMRLVARHPNVTSDTLTRLSKSSDSYVVGDVVANSATPQQIIENIYANIKSYQYPYLIERGLSFNNKTPVKIIESLAQSRNQYTLRQLKLNITTPESVRKFIIDRIEKKDYD